MKSTTLKLEERKQIGGGRARKLLKDGLIPAVVYGRDMKSTAAFVNGSELKKFIRDNGRNSVFSTEFSEEHDLSMLIKNIQYDPVNKEIIHLDFQKLNLDERVQVNIPVRIKGIENMKNNGNVIIHQLDTITIECLPRDIPPYIAVDISDFHSNQSFTAGDLKFSPEISLITKPGKVILTLKGHEKEAASEENS